MSCLKLQGRLRWLATASGMRLLAMALLVLPGGLAAAEEPPPASDDSIQVPAVQVRFLPDPGVQEHLFFSIDGSQTMSSDFVVECKDERSCANGLCHLTQPDFGACAVDHEYADLEIEILTPGQAFELTFELVDSPGLKIMGFLFSSISSVLEDVDIALEDDGRKAVLSGSGTCPSLKKSSVCGMASFNLCLHGTAECTTARPCCSQDPTLIVKPPPDWKLQK